jgi:hypothetical protein
MSDKPITHLDLEIGKLVSVETTNKSFGIVEYCDSEHIRILWDDGTIGLLYWDWNMMPCAYRLRKEPE